MANENTLDLGAVTEYIQITSEIIHEQEQKIASLNEDLSKSRTALEKAASAPAEAPSKQLNESAVLKVMQKIAKVRPGVLTGTPEDVTEKLVQNPELALDLMDKMAGDAFGVQVSKMGAPVLADEHSTEMPKTAAKVSIERESDKLFESTFLG